MCDDREQSRSRSDSSFEIVLYCSVQAEYISARREKGNKNSKSNEVLEYSKAILSADTVSPRWFRYIPCVPIVFNNSHGEFHSNGISKTDSLMRNVRVYCRVTDCSWPEDRIIMSETRESVHGPRSAPSTVRAAMSMPISTNGAAYCTQQDGCGSRVQN
jgi:hypothetical protein